jgi:hypothetical protein
MVSHEGYDATVMILFLLLLMFVGRAVAVWRASCLGVELEP